MSTKSFVYKWWFKVIIVLVMFLPAYTQVPLDSRYTINVIAQVLMSPYVARIAWVLPIAKLALLAAAVAPAFARRHGARIVLGYYAAILVLVAIFQDLAHTQYGFTFLPGSSLAQLVVAALVVGDVARDKSQTAPEDFDRGSVWVIPLMVLALLMPYAIKYGIIVPSLQGVLANEAGVTYCMITPVVVGTLILFRRQVHAPTLHAISYLGFCFGILTMLTWFVFEPQSWWMGVCHLPLLVISFYGMRVSR